MSNKFKNPYLQVTDQLTGGSEPKNPYLQHGWGNSAKAKQKEKEYNRKYYEEHKKDKWGVGEGLKRFGQSVNETLQKHNDNWQRGMDMILNKNVTSQTTPASTMQKKKVNSYNSHANDEKARQQQAKRKYDNYTISQTHPSTPSPSDIEKAKKNAERNAAYAENMKNTGHAISPSQYEAERRKETVSGRRAAANAANEADKQRRGREHYWRDYETPRRKKEATEQYLRARAHEGSGALKFLDDEAGYQNYLKNERAQNKEKRQEYESVSKEIALAARKQKQIQDKIDKNNKELAKLLYPSATGNNSVSQKDSIAANKSRIDIIKKQLENDKKAYANMTKQINSLNETLNRYRSE